MSLSSLSLKRPVMAMVFSIIIVLFGLIGFDSLGVREYPSIDPPIITVRTAYTGASSQVIESQITEPIEKAINGIAGIKSISSASNQGSSSITVEFNLEVDLEAAANDVRDKVSQAVRQLPQDIDAPPVVTKSDANSDAIVSMTLESNVRNHLQISDYAANVILERLQTIPGVSTVQIWGEKKYAMRIWLDPARLSSYQLTALDVQNALNRENIELPGGKIAGDATELTINTMGKLMTEDDFNNLIISSNDGYVIRLRDVATARLGPENEETILKQSGTPMIGLAIVPQPGSNYIEITDEFYRRYDQLQKDLPKDFKLDIALDNTTFIRRSIGEVEETLLIAFLLVVVIIYLFFRDWLIAIRPLIDIPVSLIGAFFIMYVAGFSVNILTLLAIVLATGLVVDDGIVVTENIYKKIEEGMEPAEAAEKGSNEIFFAVVATSLTLAVVFLPIIFLEGFVGRLFREFGIVMAGAILISAFVSLSLTPVLNVKLARKNHKHSRFYERTEPFFVAMTENYRKSLAAFIRVRYWAWIILASTLGIVYVVSSSLQSELAPLEDRNFVRLSVLTPEGTAFGYMDNFMDRLVNFVNDSIPEKRIALSVTAPGFTGSGAVNTGFVRIGLKDANERNRSQQQVADYVTKNAKFFPEGKIFALQEQTIGVGGSSRTGLPVQYVLQGPNFEKLKEVLPRFMEEASKNPTFQGVDVNLKFNKPELNISIDRDRAAALGVSVNDIAQTLQFSYSGRRMSYFTMNGKQYQVIAQVDRENRDEPIDLKSLYVKNKSGELIQMDNVVKVVEESSPPQLYHYNRYKSATVSAGLAPGKTIGDGIDAMDEISKKVLDDSFSTELTGPSRDFAESGSNILFAFILALVLIYLILAAQFESFIDPFIIMLTVPLALGGAVLALWMFNQTLNIFSQIGIIMLIGLVTKNGILIVEFANQRKDAGLSVRDAAVDASTSRLRPILMTSIATILGALPIAIGLGNGAQSRIPMGIVVVGGLLFSLILTLYVIPAVYTFISKEKRNEAE
ncbi:MAG: efflux RND transporter permease subunit [Bacteroidia bacterium]|nr:efflux RND transporter permease subunit [Bacteroidota bacterium]MBP9789237.1 efflux RND transporter permease subunit [Bacteroidia bacterium]MBP9922430.1 efflux RND transporter permease subunit [Bacteroidia bacterium]